MPSRAEATRRYLALARAVLRARRRPFDPFKLTWILTERCSLRCGTCHLWATEPAPGPDVATVRAVARSNRHLTWVNLSGGDFVERSDGADLVEAVVSGCPDLALLDFPTAGQDPERTLSALQPALDSDVPRIYVTVSIDGPDAVHDRVRGRSGAGAAARETLARLQRITRRGFRAVPGMTLSRRNLPATPPEDPSTLLPPDVDPADLHVNLAHHSGHYYRNTEDVTPPTATALAVMDAVERGRSRWPTPLRIMERLYGRRARRFLRTGDAGGRCGALRSSVYVGADLTVFPCTIYDRPLGRLADVGWSLRRIPELPGARDALADVEARRCPRCWSPCEAFPSLLVGTGRAS